jgi:hypothetical protein
LVFLDSKTNNWFGTNDISVAWRKKTKGAKSLSQSVSVTTT